MSDLKSFQSTLYQNIPLVNQMQLQLLSISDNELSASAPIAPNINDKSTVFGGSSAALMTISGWTLIKYHLESHQLKHDVVIHKAQTNWKQAQYDDLIIQVKTRKLINWHELIEQLNRKNRTTKVTIECHVLNQANQVCSVMSADYVILKSDNPA